MQLLSRREALGARLWTIERRCAEEKALSNRCYPASSSAPATVQIRFNGNSARISSGSPE